MAANNSIQTLKDLSLEASREKYPNFPDKYRPAPRYKETTTNDLTRAIIDYINLKGGYAVRINTQGQYDQKTGKWRKGMTRRGTADIHACWKGRHYSIEIKTGKDRLSPEQIETRADVEKAGGIYIVAGCLDDVVARLT